MDVTSLLEAGTQYNGAKIILYNVLYCFVGLLLPMFFSRNYTQTLVKFCMWLVKVLRGCNADFGKLELLDPGTSNKASTTGDFLAVTNGSYKCCNAHLN